MENSYVKTHIESGIATVEFYHEKQNAMPSSQLIKLAESINACGLNQEVLVVILKSVGDKTFCAGASFDELLQISNAEMGLEFFSGFARVINAMRTCPKFIVARIQGKTVGGGVGLAASADYAFAHTSASVKLSELAVGIGPFVVGPAVERKMGLAGMSELAIDASSWRSAEWAMQKGLFNQVFDCHEALDEAVSALAHRLAHSSPDAMRQLKRIFWEGTEKWDQLLSERAAISGELVLSNFTKNAISAFKQK